MLKKYFKYIKESNDSTSMVKPDPSGLNEVLNPWSKLLGQNAIVCSDHTKISEVTTTISICFCKYLIVLLLSLTL